MPIQDYKKIANRIEQKIMSEPDISENNKRLLQRFLTAYDVSDARRLIFLDKIKPVLKYFPDLEKTLTDRDGMNSFFAGLRRRYAPATYATYLSVVARFLSWINEGEKPICLLDLKHKASSKIKRNLRPEDMLTWKEGQRIADASCNIQLSAIVQTQLDCGFRPSEFHDLNYGDVEMQTGLALINVREGKTGARPVVAQRCVPALLKWINSHPTKRPEDPLWISEKSIYSLPNGQVQVKRYPYPAMRKRVRVNGKKAGISKPLDFYGLRHSSCVLDKMDNLPVDLAAERHGHSVKHYVGTYGRLSVKDVVKRFHSHYGTEAEETPKLIQHTLCPTCKTLNGKNQNWCSECGTPLNAKGAMDTAHQQGLVGRKKNIPSVQAELEQMKAKLSASSEREEAYRREQLQLLREMQNIRSALMTNIPPANMPIR